MAEKLFSYLLNESYLKPSKQLLVAFFLSLLLVDLNFANAEEPFTPHSLTIDLKDPTFTDGVLTTSQGGVIQGPDIRLQARRLTYMNLATDGRELKTVDAEEDVQVIFGRYLIIGERIEYDFVNRRGRVYNGRVAVAPWYCGGEVIELGEDGGLTIQNAFLTTSENIESDWEITAEEATISSGRELRAHQVHFKIVQLPVLWLPSFKVNLDSIFDSPLKYTVRWGGRQRTCFGVIYEALSYENFKSFIELDYRIKRGFGGGVHTEYISPDRLTYCETINYLAKDSSADNPHEEVRFRFQGVYRQNAADERSSIEVTYDKLSDKDMATDYDDRGLELDIAGRTQLHVRHQENFFTTNFLTRVRINSFQTIKQELPSLETVLKPIYWQRLGIYSQNSTKVSYLDYVYSKGLKNINEPFDSSPHSRNGHNARSYQSSRYEICQQFYRPIKTGPITTTPEIGGRIVYYGNSPHNNSQLLCFGQLGIESQLSMHRYYKSLRHVIIPYVRYDFLSFPTSPPNEHYIFDMDDGWYRLSVMRFGTRQSLFFKDSCGFIGRSFYLDVWANAFFDTPTIIGAIPKLYSTLTWNSLPTLQHSFGVAWDFPHGCLDHFNFRTGWTVSEDIALTMEYRHRDAFDWRKVDKDNFILDSYRSVKELEHSQLSDRRDTLLLHAFCRLQHNFAVEISSRHGWNRHKGQPRYTEYEIDFLTTFRSALNLKIALQHKENERNDNRIAIYFSLGLDPPDRRKYDCFVPTTVL